MDNSQGVRKPRSDSTEASAHVSALLKEQQTPTVVDSVRAGRTVDGPKGRAWRSRAVSVDDPEPTEEIGGDPGIAPARRRVPQPAQKVPVPRYALEPTDPVASGADVGEAAPAQLPDIREILCDSSSPAPGDHGRGSGSGILAQGSRLARRYVILDEVEYGSMGHVYKALDEQRERAGSPEPFVALKVARADTAGNLRREFLKLSALRHPNIVAVYDFGSANGLDFMVMEWLQGESLASVLAGLSSRRMALSTAEEIVRSTAAALAHTHAAGIVHGDVKPSNVFVTRDQLVKLLDFGASARSAPGASDADENGWATRAYASCEVLQGKPPGPADDVFALGVTAYRLLSGERPFGDLDALAAKAQGLVPPELPADAFASWPAVRNALQYDAMDRPADAALFLQQLEDEADGADDAVFPRQVPAQLTVIAWGLLAALVLGLSAWWSMGESDSSSAQPRIEQMLGDAEAAAAAGRLTEPPADSALALYSAVLQEDPDNLPANEGLDRLARHYLERARAALASEDFGEAVAGLEQARRIRPDHFGIAAIEDLIARYRRDLLVSARESAGTDSELAGRYLAQAEALSSGNDPELAGVRAELQRAAAAAEVESLVREIDERILSERLLVPAGNSAIDLLQRASRLAPGDRQVQLARDRIASALLFQAMFSISNGNLGEAGAFIDAANDLDVRHLALARAEYELAKARSEALETGEPGR